MNVLDLLREDGITARKAAGTKGGEWHGPCPGCGGTDRFHCWPEQNGGEGSWWCRGCGAGGDAIRYLMDFRGLDFRAAAAHLGRTLEARPPRPLLPPRRRAAPASRAPGQAREPGDRWRARAGELVDEAHARLLRTPGQLALLERRGLPLEAVRRYRLGWLPEDVYRQRTAWGLPQEAHPQTGKPRKLWIPAGLTIPVFRQGLLHRVRVRRPQPGAFGPRKYYWVPGSGSGTMVLNPEARAFVVVEAELDAMLCDFASAGDVGALGLGTISAKPDAWTHGLLAGSLTILNALDFEPAHPAAPEADEAARREAEGKARQQRTARDWWQAAFEQADRWPVPEAKDPGDAFAAGVDIGAWIRAGLPPVMTLPLAPPVPRAAPVPPALPAARPAPETPAPAPKAAPAGRPANLPALHRLLCDTGIHLTFSGSRPFDIPREIERHRAFPGILARLKELCFRDDELGAYLDRHPAAIITAQNLVVR